MIVSWTMVKAFFIRMNFTGSHSILRLNIREVIIHVIIKPGCLKQESNQ